MDKYRTETYGGLENLLTRNQFYRDNYRRLMIVCFLLVGLLLASFGFTYYVWETRPEPKYFATTYQGDVVPLVPLNQPVLGDQELADWSVLAVRKSLSFNYATYRQTLQNSRQYFTIGGYELFVGALNDSKNLKAVKDEQFVVSAQLSGEVEITGRGLVPINDTISAYAWNIKMPLTLTYQNAKTIVKQQTELTMLVRRVPTLAAPKGIGIQTFNLKDIERR